MTRRKTPLSLAVAGIVFLLETCHFSGLYHFHRELVQIDQEISAGRGLAAEARSLTRRRDKDSIDPTGVTVDGPSQANNSLVIMTDKSLDEYDSNSTSASQVPQPSIESEANHDDEDSSSSSTDDDADDSSSTDDETNDDESQSETQAPIEIESPYEERWPKYWLPWWAKKRQRLPTKPDKSICFVHVGKTAGSTVGCALGFGLHCHGDTWQPKDSLLSQYTTHMLHSSINNCRLDHDYYLITLRDPIQRLLSWYLYEERQLDKLRVDCPFPTLNDLALKGLPWKSPDASDECQIRARRAIAGEEKFGYHNYHNYGFHIRQVPFNASIVVIRTEHLADDWNSIEAYLGSPARVTAFPRHNPSSSTTPHTTEERYISNDARSNLCEQLCNEIQVLKHILSRAVNLQPQDVEISMQELRQSCPRETDMPACPF